MSIVLGIVLGVVLIFILVSLMKKIMTFVTFCLGPGPGAGLHHAAFDFNDEAALIGASFFPVW